MLKMNRADTASARHNTYLLLSRLFLDGLSDDLMPYVNNIPELSAVCPHPFDAEEAAVDHHQVFSFDVFPYESIFRDPSGLVGGATTLLVQDSYEQSSFQRNVDSDHIAYELAFLAFLCMGEASALENKQAARADRNACMQQQFLQDHLLCWLPPFVIALFFSDHPFYTAVGQLTLRLVYDHILQLGKSRTRWSIGLNSSKNYALPEAPHISQDKQAGLKQVSHFLITPPFSGLYLGRSAIARLARNRQLPRGFGDRQQLLSNLLHTAGQYDVVPDLLQDLIVMTNTWNKAYQEQLEKAPQIDGWIRPWQQRVIETANSLVQMSNMVYTAA
jgi:TorA maturation chaperone TorD